MIDPHDPEYDQTRSIRCGATTLSPRFAGTADWIESTFEIRPLNLYLDRIEPDQRPRLQIIYEWFEEAALFEDADGFNFDEAKQAAISSRFTSEDPEFMQTDRLFVAFSAFEPIARWDTNSRMGAKYLSALDRQAKTDGFWKFLPEFESAVLFTYTSRQASDLRESFNDSDSVKLYRSCLAEFDEFDYFATRPVDILLDSQERFKAEFGGSWGNYYRR